MSSQHIVDKNIKGGYVTLRFNNTGSSWLHEANGVGETVNSMKLSNVLWSANQSGTWTIQRGANVVLTLTGSGRWDLHQEPIVVENAGEQVSNVVCSMSANANGCLILKFHKSSTFDPETPTGTGS
ncbi:MAG: hypothetical protein QGH83_01035 [Candidatus Pacebacteria bacterium]|jgi:hypothetical protein|nr:hypothetical protein [Candidatus Paceibacterota bacterium]|tara:strand:+ start:252 stop:629 length:378 start_codon:yes stop_codon:yes gene_type:complete